ncbi:MATE family efflux transporter [Planctomycetota bacterium]
MKTMTKKSNAAVLTEGPIGPILMRLSAPMLISILAMMAFNVIDTFFVARLGTVALAAMTLTFPVVLVVGTFALGLGVGAMAVISRDIGAGARDQICRHATDALSLTVLCVAVLTGVGLFTIEPLFRLLGASEAMLPLIRQYMIIWYPGMVVYVVPMIGNNIIRATGDTLTPSIVMLIGIAINALLDPLLIFGWGRMPALGITGAALATVLARLLTLIVALWVLHRREHLLTHPWPGARILLRSWQTILKIGLPVAISNVVLPIAMGMITRMVTQFGEAAVAGFGVATRIEAFGLSVFYALSTGISPFVGQNFGAGRFDRIQRGLSLSFRFCMAWGALLLVVLLIGGRRVAAVFDPDPGVIASASSYLWIIALSLGLRGVHNTIWTALNVMHRPYDALGLEFLLAFALWIPLAWLGARVSQLTGLYGGLCVANILAGAVALVWVQRVMKKVGRTAD